MHGDDFPISGPEPSTAAPRQFRRWPPYSLWATLPDFPDQIPHQGQIHYD